MDRLEALGSTLSQITMYDIKSMYNQAKNVVLNVSEIEAKVREATNDEPWGASSTLMQDIANRTFNYPDFNEIMPSIYARFMEKEARQWRQIYKALQLLEYLIKNGSERVVDDARSHVSTIKMLRNFHYIDDKGKDEGLNVRNRSRELVELLSDVDKIRGERRKAKANKNKYIGTGSDGGMSFGGDSGGRYGGFGSDSLGYSGGGGGSSDYYGGGGGSSSGGGGGSSGGFRDERRPGGGFDEYNAGDDEIGVVNGGRTTSPVNQRRSVPERKATAPPPPPPPAPPVNLIDDDVGFAAPAAPVQPPAPAPAPQPFVGMAPAKPSLHDMLKGAPAPATPPTYVQPPPRTGMGMGMGTGMGTGMGWEWAWAPAGPRLPWLHLLAAPPVHAQLLRHGPMAPQPKAAPTPAPATPNKPAASFDDCAGNARCGGREEYQGSGEGEGDDGLWGSGGQKPPRWAWAWVWAAAWV
ncbi:ENTH-domain-containing protein [Mycena leptocephala]|nr:ENTH-domain-containing protein [Mycena leptocephala]